MNVTRPPIVTLFLSALITCLLLNVPPALASQYFGDAEAIVVRVIDGDTLVVNIPSYPKVIGESISIRIAGCDTPELRSRDPKERTRAAIARKALLQFTPAGKKILLKNIRRGKFFRIVADVIVQGTDIASYLIENGYAVRW